MNISHQLKRYGHVALVVLIFIVALTMRLRAAALLPVDYDEDDYLRSGQLYAQHLARADLLGVINERDNYEHPPLTKLAFGAVLFGAGEAFYQTPVIAGKNATAASPTIAPQIRPLRLLNVVVGSLTAALIGLVNPLAGLLVATNSWHIKYTSQAMLEGLPALFAALTLVLLQRSQRNGDSSFWLAAVALGMAAGGKYLYGAAACGALVWMIQREPQPQWWQRVGTPLLWGMLALLSFYLINPALWPDPIGRLLASLRFGVDFAASAHVRNVGFGWAQPLVWLIGAVPWHAGIIPLLLDGLFGVLALVMVWQQFRHRRYDIVSLWFAAALIFLFLWPTKWPQYILTVTVPVSLLASQWLRQAWQHIYQAWQRWRNQPPQAQRTLRSALAWLFPSLVLFVLLIIYPLIIQTALASSDFRGSHIRGGVSGLLEATGRGMLGLRPGESGDLLQLITGYDSAGRPVVIAGNSSQIPDYYGMGGVVYLLGWPEFLPILRFTLIWTLITMLLAAALGVWLAKLLHQPGVWGRQFWLLIFILPWAVPEFVGALIWNTLFDDAFGGINSLLGTQIKWLSDPTPLIPVASTIKPVSSMINAIGLTPIGETLDFIAAGLSTNKAFWVMTLVGVWLAFPFMLLTALAALRMVPTDVYDAAQVDGASRWQIWRLMTWPLIRPFILAGGLLRGAMLFNAFHIPMMLIGDTQRTGTTTIAAVGYFVLRFDSGYSIAALINTIVLVFAALFVWFFHHQTQVGVGVDYQ